MTAWRDSSTSHDLDSEYQSIPDLLRAEVTLGALDIELDLARVFVFFGLVQRFNLYLGIMSLLSSTPVETEATQGQEVNPQPCLLQF